MKASSLAIGMMAMTEDVHNAIDHARNQLQQQFTSDAASNELAAVEAEMNQHMINYIVSDTMISKYNKLKDASKKALDAGVNDPLPVAGQRINLYETNMFKFCKKQNMPGETMSANDVITALNRLGVDASIIKEATKMATKERKGNVYYEITTTEE